MRWIHYICESWTHLDRNATSDVLTGDLNRSLGFKLKEKMRNVELFIG